MSWSWECGRFDGDRKIEIRKMEVRKRGAGLYGVVFEGGGEAGDVLAIGGALDFEANLVLLFGSGFAKNDDGAEGFGVDARHQKGVAALEILPELADLDFAGAHCRKRL
jgi:hypothetical protein